MLYFTFSLLIKNTTSILTTFNTLFLNYFIVESIKLQLVLITFHLCHSNVVKCGYQQPMGHKKMIFLHISTLHLFSFFIFKRSASVWTLCNLSTNIRLHGFSDVANTCGLKHLLLFLLAASVVIKVNFLSPTDSIFLWFIHIFFAILEKNQNGT